MTKKKKSISEFTHTLTSPIKVARKAEEELVFTLRLKSPTARHRAHLIRLKQGFLRAAVSAQRNQSLVNDAPKAAEPEDAEITGEAIMALLYISDVDLAGLEDEFRLLLLAGVCETEDGVVVNPHTIEQLSLHDFEAMMGAYLANFIISSST